MKLRIKKEGPWTIGDRQRTFTVGQEVEAGVDVPDDVAKDMLDHGYAEPAVTKQTLVTETKEKVTTAEETPAGEAAPEKKPRRRRKATPKGDDV